jgi:hypothetical protein
VANTIVASREPEVVLQGVVLDRAFPATPALRKVIKKGHEVVKAVRVVGLDLGRCQQPWRLDGGRHPPQIAGLAATRLGQLKRPCGLRPENDHGP